MLSDTFIKRFYCVIWKFVWAIKNPSPDPSGNTEKLGINTGGNLNGSLRRVKELKFVNKVPIMLRALLFVFLLNFNQSCMSA